jgi:hypothetical protein
VIIALLAYAGKQGQSTRDLRTSLHLGQSRFSSCPYPAFGAATTVFARNDCNRAPIIVNPSQTASAT